MANVWETEMQRLEKEKIERMKAQGFETYEFVKLNVGENKIEFDLSKTPKNFENKFGKERRLLMTTDGKALAVSIVLYSDILRKIVSSKAKDKITLTIVRVGESATDTRYTIK